MTASNACSVGVGTSIITPPLPTALAGYGDRTGLAEAVHDDLEARAVVIDDPTSRRRCCLLTLDLLGTTPEVGRPIRAAVARVLGIDPEAVLTSCTHTHAGPGTIVGAEILGWGRPDGYLEELPDLAAEAATAALAALAPAQATFVRVELPDGVAENRRGHPLRPSVAVVDLRSVAGPAAGERLGTIVNLGMHPTVTGPANACVATDWVGPFRRALEALAGGTAVLLQGCQGDVNPAARAWDHDDPCDWAPVVDEVGATIAAAVADALALAEPVALAVQATPSTTIDVPVDETILGALAGGVSTRTIALQALDLGGVRIVGLPGEAFHAAELELRDQLTDPVLLAGLAPDWEGYLPVPFTDGYEEQLSFGATATGRILTAAAQQADPT